MTKIHTQMNNSLQKEGSDQDLRSYIKSQHKKFYAVCRLFANNYKEHQRLFFDIIAAVGHNLRHNRSGQGKQTLLLRACVNMSALHAISLRVQPDTDRGLQFKSPDYQRCMVNLREHVGEVSEYEKIVLFLGFENVSPEDMAELTGVVPVNKIAAKEHSVRNFIPYLKEKLIWS